MRIRILPAALAALAVIAVSGCGDASKTTKLTLDAKGRTLFFVEDNHPKGASVGDERVFSQGLVTTDGKPAGRLDGSVTISQEATRAGRKLEYRVGTVQYTLDGGTVVVSGVYTAAPGQFIPAAGVTRPIVGGSGKYKGARGQVTQTPQGKEIHNVLDIETPEG